MIARFLVAAICIGLAIDTFATLHVARIAFLTVVILIASLRCFTNAKQNAIGTAAHALDAGWIRAFVDAGTKCCAIAVQTNLPHTALAVLSALNEFFLFGQANTVFATRKPRLAIRICGAHGTLAIEAFFVVRAIDVGLAR